MGLNKDQLILDTTALSESDNVGAYLRSSDGTLLTHTDVGGKKALDVNVANAIALDAATLAALENITATVSGTVELGATTLAALESITATVSGTVEIGATSLAALESITVQNGAGAAAVNIQDGGNSITVDGTVELGSTSLAALENITVSATDLDIRNLVFATDKVDASGSVVALDAPTLAALENISVAFVGAGSVVFSAVSVDATVGGTDLVATDLANRRKILIQNIGSKSIFIGNSGVTIATGIKVGAGLSAEFELGAACNIYGITAAGTADIRIMELA
jgi:hypothetical protein